MAYKCGECGGWFEQCDSSEPVLGCTCWRCIEENTDRYTRLRAAAQAVVDDAIVIHRGGHYISYNRSLVEALAAELEKQ